MNINICGKTTNKTNTFQILSLLMVSIKGLNCYALLNILHVRFSFFTITF